MSRSRLSGRLLPVAGLVVALLAAVLAGAASAEYTLSSSTVACGGTGFTVAGTYAFTATIGQLDASPSRAGGAYALVGGFWIAVPVTPVTLVSFDIE